MPDNRRDILSIGIAILFFTFIILLGISKFSSQMLPLIFLLVPIIFIITFVNTDVALIILIFSMLLSPELQIAQVPARSVVVRIDDILIIVVFFSWLAKMAINKELGLLKRTPLNSLIVTYILVFVLSTGIGILTGHIKPLKSFFYILKYAEYFMLFFLVINNIRDKKQIKTFIVVFLITCVLTSIYALATVGAIGRATAPFEGPAGEANTLGGYLVLLFAIVAGLFLYSPSKKWLFWCGGLTFLIILTLMQTLSRGSYLGVIFVYLTLTILTRRRRLLLIGMLILSIVILPVIVPTKVVNRIKNTFTVGEVYEPLGRRIVLDQSTALRIESWRKTLKLWTHRPFLGYGVSGVGLVDTQFPLILGETGIIGFLVFMWLIMIIFRFSLYTFNTIEDDWSRGLSLGFLAGLVGLLIHSFSANTFIIVRIMEPFWFLTAIIMMLPSVQEET
ncbi:MAG: O-antigen ligase family protein [bacterium]